MVYKYDKSFILLYFSKRENLTTRLLRRLRTDQNSQTFADLHVKTINFHPNNKYLTLIFFIKSPTALLLITQNLEITQSRIFPSLKCQACDMQVGENVQLQMKCLGGLKSKPQNLKNLLAVISCGISYNRLSK